MASNRFDLPTPLAPATQVNGPKRTSTSSRFLKPLTFSRVSMTSSIHRGCAGVSRWGARGGAVRCRFGRAGGRGARSAAPPHTGRHRALRATVAGEGARQSRSRMPKLSDFEGGRGSRRTRHGGCARYGRRRRASGLSTTERAAQSVTIRTGRLNTTGYAREPVGAIGDGSTRPAPTVIEIVGSDDVVYASCGPEVPVNGGAGA